MEKLTILPLIAESGKGESQKMGFWYKDKTWDKHLTSEEEALKSFDEIQDRRKKLSPIERRYTSNQIARKCNSETRGDQGWKEADGLLVNEVRNGNPPIDKLSGNCQLEFKFL